jgi:hypothetical protein
LRGFVATCLVLGRSLPDLLAVPATASLAGGFSMYCGGLRGLPMPPVDVVSKLTSSAYLLPLGVSFRVPAAAGIPSVDSRRPPAILPPASFLAPPPFSTRCVYTRQGSEEPGIASAAPPATGCSVRMVSHHLDGFLRTELPGVLHPEPVMGFVAFPAFVLRREQLRIPATLTPLDEVPSPVAVPHHCGSLPSCRSCLPLERERPATPRPCSTDESVV